MDATDRLIKQTTRQFSPLKISGVDDFVFPNRSGVLENVRMHGCLWTSDGTSAYLKTDSGTTILTINLTTGNMTLGGTQKRVICTKVVGA